MLRVRQVHIKLFSVLILVISLGVYLFFACYDGVVIAPDSVDYINMNTTREPFYSVFLALSRMVCEKFGIDIYLMIVVLLQSVLAAIASWSLVIYIFKNVVTDQTLSMVILSIILAVSLLTRFVIRGTMFSNCILTEGITVSCYTLYFRYLMEFVTRKTRKSFLICCVIVSILVSTRRQMIISLILLVICVLGIYLHDKQYCRGLLISFLCVACIFLGCIFWDAGYNRMSTAEGIRTSSNKRFIATMVVYAAEKDDSNYIQNEEIKNLFLEIYDICEEEGFLRKSAGTGWFRRAMHIEDCYDQIQLATMMPIINRYIEQIYCDDDNDYEKKLDEIISAMNRAVLPHVIPELAETFIDSFRMGLVTTVSGRNLVLRWYSLFVYLLYVTLMLYYIVTGENRKILLFVLLTLVSIILNVGLVSLVIYCQARYVIYNMILFYISLVLMIEPFVIKTIKGYESVMF